MSEKRIETTATITCPKCGFRKGEAMPTGVCVYFYRCAGCREMITPKPTDCCVFCSYSDKKCPSKQAEK